jgi:PAS domain S-box-containing protein
MRQNVKIKTTLETLIDTVPAGVFVTDQAGQCTFVNKTWSDLTGLSFDSALGSGWIKAIHPEDLEKVGRSWNEFVKGQAEFDLIYRFLLPNGHIHVVHGRASILLGTSGVVEGYVGSLQDITVQEQIREDLDRTNRDFDRFFNVSSDLLCIADFEGKFIQVNPAWTTTFGYSYEELVSRPFLEFIHPDDQAATLFECEKLKDGKTTAYFENRYQTKKGKWRRLSWMANPDQIAGVIYGVAHDVTHERQREMDLEEAQRVARIGSWSFDSISEEIVWSKQMYFLFPEDPLKGPPTLERHRSTIHESDRQSWSDAISKCLIDGIPYTMRFRAVFPNSKIVWIESNGEGVFSGNQIIGLRGTCQDVTTLVMIEEQVKTERSRALQNSKLASLGEMSSGIAHEINNPLTVILGLAWSLMKYVGQPEMLQDKVDMIEGAARRIEHIVAGLKRFSRTTSPQNVRITKLLPIIDDALTIVGAKQRKYEVEIIKDFHADPSIKCDEIEIEQVIVNLVNNALDAVEMADKRWIRITVKQIDDKVMLQVVDSGPGIKDEEVKSRLFDPFFTTKIVGQGTGLGLSISRSILIDHDSTIELLDGDHTCFQVKLPVCLPSSKKNELIL